MGSRVDLKGAKGVLGPLFSHWIWLVPSRVIVDTSRVIGGPSMDHVWYPEGH